MASRKPSRLVRSLRKGGLPRTPAEVWAAGLGALGGSKGGRGRFDALVAEGRRVQAEGGEAVRQAIERVERAAARAAEVTLGAASDTVQDGIERAVEAAAAAVGLPGPGEVRDLQDRLVQLNARVAALADRSGEPASVAVEAHPAGWAVRLVGGPDAPSVYATKKEAVAAGRRLARAQAPSRLVVHRADGTAGESVEYGPGL
ncbi:MAG TPA: DUF2188 domain-containing protein [Rubricoccaceae bacterium]|jgi:hypothetical protein